jgi:hypothetical protein
MSALRITLFFENGELDVNTLPWEIQRLVIQTANRLWQSAETPTVKYRTQPEDDGRLYVTPGVFGECRCSEVEVTLPDKLGEFDFDDHHFEPTVLPEDVSEKKILYDSGGYLYERLLVGDFHPVFEGINVKFEMV